MSSHTKEMSGVPQQESLVFYSTWRLLGYFKIFRLVTVAT